MTESFRVFDFHRIFVGDAPALYFFEIIFRTIIMYSYTVLLLRVLGKRGMGQLSMLELAIIISFGSAVGDPMIGAEMPIFYGALAITVVTVLQIGLERLINKNRKVETVMEGKANVVVSNGVIDWTFMKEDNISKEDLFRSLREKNVQHLGEVKKVYFETSGNLSVFFRSSESIVPGLSVEPEETINKDDIVSKDDVIKNKGHYSCFDCGHTEKWELGTKVVKCRSCGSTKWIASTQ